MCKRHKLYYDEIHLESNHPWKLRASASSEGTADDFFYW